MIKVLLADDHTLVRAGIKSILEQSPDIQVIAEASSGLEAIEQYKTIHPDVVVLDISMPEMDGLETVKYLKTADPTARILILTMHPERQYAVRLLKAGVLGYITKGTSTRQLHQAVQSVAQGRRFLLEEGIDAVTARVLAHGSGENLLETLSDRELQVLCLIARGYKVKEVATELGVGRKTIETYRSRILEKLSLRNDVEVCRFAIEHGIVDFVKQGSEPPERPE